MILGKEVLGIYWLTGIQEKQSYKNVVFQWRKNTNNNYVRVQFRVKGEQSFGANDEHTD